MHKDTLNWYLDGYNSVTQEMDLKSGNVKKQYVHHTKIQ